MCLRSLPLFSFHLVSQFGLKERYFLFIAPADLFSQQSTIVFVLSDFDLLRSVRVERPRVEQREEKRDSGQRAVVPAQAYSKLEKR